MLIDFLCSPNRREGLGAEGRGGVVDRKKEMMKEKKRC